MELVTGYQRREQLSDIGMNRFDDTMRRCVWSIRICLNRSRTLNPQPFVFGGGVCISSSGHILSVASIFTAHPSDLDNIYGRIGDGEEFPLTLSKIDQDSNLALLTVRSEADFDFTSVSLDKVLIGQEVATIINYENRFLSTGYVSCPERRFKTIEREMQQWGRVHPHTTMLPPCFNGDTKLMQIHRFPTGEDAMFGRSLHGFPVFENTGKVIGLISAQGLDFCYGLRFSDSLKVFLEDTPVSVEGDVNGGAIGGSKTTEEGESSRKQS